MGVIRWKTKNIIYLSICMSLVLTFYLTVLKVNQRPVSSLLFGNRPVTECNSDLRWYQHPRKVLESSARTGKPPPVVAILAAPGSGELWLRKLVEQLLGYYTGSTVTNSTHQYFVGDGVTDKVMIVLGNDVDGMPPMTSAVVVYRDMKDTLLTHYSQQLDPGNFIEKPQQTYFGTKWMEFATKQSQLWVERYSSYMDIAIPLVVVQYDQMFNPVQLQNILLRIANHVHVPIKQSHLSCLLETSQLSPLLPKPHRANQHPFEFISRLEMVKIQQAEMRVVKRLEEAHRKFQPKV